MAALWTAPFDIGGLTPHGFCLAWEPGLIWLQAGSDTVIALAYFSIPLALSRLIQKRRDLAFSWMFWLAAAFILACGTTHLMGVLTLWVPAYWLDGEIKAVTAALSIGAALVLWPLIPRVIALPSPSDLRALNDALSRQVVERDQAAAKLRESEARQRALYDHSPAALHTLDRRGRVIAVSDQWLAMLGYERNEVIGRPIVDFHVPSSSDRFVEDFDQTWATGTLRDCERRFVCRSGEARDMLVSASLDPPPGSSNPDPGVARVLATLVDVTARKQAEAALRTSQERLRQAQTMEAVGQLTGGVAHDFNNALTVIMGSLELMQRHLPETETARRLSNGAMTAAQRAAGLTSQLLAFSRKQHLLPEPLAAPAILAGLATLLSNESGVSVTLEPAPLRPDQWCCLADSEQLETALLNLVLNAHAAIGSEGHIRIAFDNLTLGAADTRTRGGDEKLLPGDYVAIAVEDDGCGMTQAVQRQALEPFFTTRPLGHGSGLGLSQAYGFARQSDGILTIESAVGVGTRVELLLPRAVADVVQPSNEDRATDQQMHPPTPAGHGARILVVEDEPELRGLIAEALTELDYSVVTAGDAEAALSVLGGPHHADILFTDVTLPGSLNGIDLALRARAEHPHLRVLFASGYTDRHLLDRWPDATELLPKPYTVDLVARALAAALHPVGQATSQSAETAPRSAAE